MGIMKLTLGQDGGGYRWKRLVPPLWCTVGIYLVICYVIRTPQNWSPIIVYGFNLQGVHNIIRSVTLPSFQGLGQTWFVTVIAVCYALMIVMKKNKMVERWIDHHTSLALSIAILIQIIFSFIGVQLSYFLQFFIGYFISRKTKGDNSWTNKKAAIIVSILAIILIGARLVTRKMIDGTILYDLVVARLSFNALAIWIVMVLVKLSKVRLFEKMLYGRAWRMIDLASYALFLTHYMFLQGPMKVSDLVSHTVSQVIVFILLTVASSAVVLLITERKQLVKLIRY